MGSGGGGDPGAEARRQEADRQQRISAATEAINAIFSGAQQHTGYRYVNTTNGASISEDEYAKLQAQHQQQVQEEASRRFANESKSRQGGLERGSGAEPSFSSGLGLSGADRATFGSGLGHLGMGAQVSATQNPAFWQRQAYTYYGPGNNNRQAMYDAQRSAVYELNARDVQRQAQEAERVNRFGLARAGLLGGSVNVDSVADMDRRTNEGLMRAGGIADQASADLLSADERTRANLLSLAQSGIDTGTAAQQALKGLEANAANAASARSAATVGDLFGSMTQAYLANQIARGQASGYGPNTGQQWFGVSGTRKGDSGTVT